MLREDIPIRIFRLIYFPIHFTVEIALVILFLISGFYNPITLKTTLGAVSMWGWILTLPSLFIICCIVLLFLSSFTMKKANNFFTNEKNLQVIAYVLSYLSLARIALIPLSLLYIIPFGPSMAYANLLIILLSLLPPFSFYFVANFSKNPEKIFALSKSAPVSIKLTSIWLVLLTGLMQIFATNITILLISLTFLVVSYFYFNLYPLSVSLTPILMIIHSAFSIFFSVTIFTHLNDQEILIDYTPPQVITITTLFFVVPAIISLVLAITFFRKKTLQWVKDIQPTEDIELYYQTDEDEEEEFEEELEEES